MLRKLRRNSKEPIEDACAVIRVDSVMDTLSECPEPKRRLSFFDLPAEIRNTIYEYVILDATLSLPTNILSTAKKSKLQFKRRKSVPTPINGLLLASRQCRQEYLSFLLSTVNVVIEVQDFDFDNVIRVASSLRPDDLETQALQSNRHLRLLLVTRNCTPKNLMSLRRWLDYRKDKEANLPWRYEFPLDKMLPPTTMGRVRLLRELEYYADMISTLKVDLNESQVPELTSIRDAFEIQARKLEADLAWLGHRSKRAPRELRGLAGGGVV